MSENTKETKKKCNCEEDSTEEDFVVSTVVGAVTNSTVIGAVVGGDVVGGLLGDLLNDGDIDIF